MILEEKLRNSVDFDKIPIGYPFMECGTNNGIYIKVLDFERGKEPFNAVRLSDGMFNYFLDSEQVEKCNAKVVY